MDQFKLKKLMIFRRVLNVLYPVAPLVGILYLVASDTIRFTDKMPMITLGLFLWLGYELFQLYNRMSYKISIGDEGIAINKSSFQWNDFVKAKLNGLRFGMDPVIILEHQNSSRVKIPASIDGLPFITSLVEKHIPLIERAGE